jgi:hypothetical protein
MMPVYYEIPTSPTPQTFSIQLGGVTYTMTLTYHEAYMGLPNATIGIDTDSLTYTDTNDVGGWILDISDANSNPIACGLPLITGIDLLYQLKYLGISGSLVATVDGDPDGVLTFNGMGTTSHLYFVTFP